MSGPLAGIRVLELTTGAAGPTVGKLLREFGAEVVRVESRQRPDVHRTESPDRWNVRPDFHKLHRGKKSLTINLRTEKGRALVRRLVPQCDVVVENYALGVLEHWGLAYDQLKALRPDIILVRVKGMGSTGPHAADVTWGPNIGNILGITHLWNYPDSELVTAEARSQHPDFLGGVTAAYCVVLALMHRAATGEGQWLDSSQLDIGAAVMGPLYLQYIVNGQEPQPVGNHSQTAAPYGGYRCKGDDRWLVLGVSSDAEWAALCSLLGEPERAAAGPFATHGGRVRHKAEVDAWIEAWTQQYDPHEAMRLLQEAGVMAAAVQDVEDQFTRDPQLAARGFLVTIDEPEAGSITTEGIPVRLSETPGAVDTHAPLMGEHTHQVARDLLGLSDAEIAALEVERVLY